MLITVEETTYCRSRRRQRVIEVPSPQERAEQIRRYVARVNQFYHQVQEWLQDYPDVVITKTPREMNEEGLDTYWVDQLTLTFNHGLHQYVEKIKPEGTNVIMCEGLLQLGLSYLAYMLKDAPHLGIDPKTGLPKPAYDGIDVDGWYWIESRGEGYAHLINKPLLLRLINFPGE